MCGQVLLTCFMTDMSHRLYKILCRHENLPPPYAHTLICESEDSCTSKSRQRSEINAGRVSSVGPNSSSLIMLVDEFQIQSDNVVRSEAEILSTYDYQTSSIERSPEGTWTVKPSKIEVQFRTQTKVPKLG